MGKIKVLLAIRPRLLSDVVRGIVERQPDLEVVRELLDLSTLVVTIRATEAAVVILTPGDAESVPALCSAVLGVYPRLTIMVLSANGDTAMLYAAGARQQRIDDVGAQAMLAAIYHA